MKTWKSFALAAALGTIAFLAFLPALSAEFVDFDDRSLFTLNPFYRGFDWTKIRWMFTQRLIGHYMPVTWLTSALDWEISGLDPSSYHRGNLVLHALNAGLFFFVAKRLIAAGCAGVAGGLRADDRRAAGANELSGQGPIELDLAAAAAALAFAVHPLRVESVAWCTERRDVLSVFFLLSALIAYLRAFPRASTRLQSHRAYLASIALLFLSLLSKAMGMTFVLVLLVIDVYPLRRLPGNPRRWLEREYRQVLVQKLPFAALALASAVTASTVLHVAQAPERSSGAWGMVPRVFQAFFQLAFYLRKTFWPTDLAALYELPYRFDPLEPRFIGSALAVVVIVLVLFALRARAPALVAGFSVYAIVLAPVLGFVRSGPQLAADRYSHLSCAPFALIFGGALFYSWRSRPGRAFRCTSVSIVIAILGVLFALTWTQTKVWHDSRTLWTHAIDVGAESAIAHNNLALLDAQAGRGQEARKHFDRALAIRPDQGEIWYTFAKVLVAMKDFSGAEQAYRRAIELAFPAFPPLAKLGDLCLDQPNRFDEAIALYRAAVKDMESLGSEWETPSIYLRLARALEKRGDVDEARELRERAGRARQRHRAERTGAPDLD